MKKTLPDFSPLTSWQLSAWEDIKGMKKALKDFHGHPLRYDAVSLKIEPSEIENTLPDIHELTANAARSGLVKRDAFGDYHIHPDLTPEGKMHFMDWVLTRIALKDRKSLRQARIGLEAKLKRPLSLEQLELKEEVLRLRGVKEEEVSGEFDFVIIPEQKQRVRKEDSSWHWVIQQLVEKQLRDQLRDQSMGLKRTLKIPKTPLGLKKMLKRLFPHIDWDRV